MPITFNEIPADIRAPAVLTEVDSSRAVQGPLIKDFTVLLIGQRLSTGTVVANTLTRLVSADDGRKKFGKGSMLHGMAKAYFNSPRRVADCYAIAVDDAGGGSQASVAISFSGTCTKAGTIFLYVAGRAIRVGVLVGDAAAAIAINVAAAINAIDDLPVTAASGVPVPTSVTITARHTGTESNEIDVRLNHNDGEDLPSGITASGAAVLSGGTTSPVISPTTYAAMGDQRFDCIAWPYLDATNLGTLHTEMLRRWGPTVQLEGAVQSAKRASVATLTTHGDSFNSQFCSTLGQPAMLVPPWEMAANYAAISAFERRQDPARPLRTLKLNGLAPNSKQRLTYTERDLLYRHGIACTTVDANGQMQLDRCITYYKQSDLGGPDTAFLDQDTIYNVAFMRWDARRVFTTKYPRHKLAADGNKFGVGQAIMTPSIAKGELIALAESWVERGLMEDLDQFKRDLVVEINASDPTRLDAREGPNLVNQFYTFALQLQFLL